MGDKKNRLESQSKKRKNKNRYVWTAKFSPKPFFFWEKTNSPNRAKQRQIEMDNQDVQFTWRCETFSVSENKIDLKILFCNFSAYLNTKEKKMLFRRRGKNRTEDSLV